MVSLIDQEHNCFSVIFEPCPGPEHQPRGFLLLVQFLDQRGFGCADRFLFGIRYFLELRLQLRYAFGLLRYLTTLGHPQDFGVNAFELLIQFVDLLLQQTGMGIRWVHGDLAPGRLIDARWDLF